MTNFLQLFRGIWVTDFEYIAPAGERQESVCMVATDMVSRRTISLWRDDLLKLTHPPFPVDEHHLFVSFNAAAELGCFLELGWKMPQRILDLYVEFRRFKSGIRSLSGSSMLAAMALHGLPTISNEEKEAGRKLVIDGERTRTWSEEDREKILSYCQTDVDGSIQLLPAMIRQGGITNRTLPGALIRGRYMAAAADIQQRGIPVDVQSLQRFQQKWDEIIPRLVRDVDTKYGVYEDTSFRESRFSDLLDRKKVMWPRLDSGKLQLDKETFKDMAKLYPYFEPLRQLRKTLGQCRTLKLQVGKDGRSRYSLFPFSSQTGRNQPGSSEFIFGLPSWLRCLIKPAEGMALAYLDWSQQELAIAAGLSGDRVMMDAYSSDDFYMAAAIAAGVAPPGATKATHPVEREMFKIVCLGVQYGMGAYGIAKRLGGSIAWGEELLSQHQRAFKVFWKWIDDITESGLLNGRLETPYGWQARAGDDPNPRSMQNFLIQGSGADMLRIACSLLVERGIHVVAPVHDALLIEAPIDEIDDAVARTQQAMMEAAAFVLNIPGFDVRSEAQIIRYPDRYRDARLPTDGTDLWTRICTLAGVTP